MTRNIAQVTCAVGAPDVCNPADSLPGTIAIRLAKVLASSRCADAVWCSAAGCPRPCQLLGNAAKFTQRPEIARWGAEPRWILLVA